MVFHCFLPSILADRLIVAALKMACLPGCFKGFLYFQSAILLYSSPPHPLTHGFTFCAFSYLQSAMVQKYSIKIPEINNLWVLNYAPFWVTWWNLEPSRSVLPCTWTILLPTVARLYTLPTTLPLVTKLLSQLSDPLSWYCSACVKSPLFYLTIKMQE